MSRENSTDLAREQIAAAEKYIPEEKEETSEGRRPVFIMAIALPVFLTLIAMVFFGLSLLRFPQAIGALRSEPPLHHGVYATDRVTDRCVANLWHIVRLMQEGQSLPKTLVCPASGKPYVVQGDTVSCPNPQAHKLSLLSVSQAHPVPEVK